MTPHNHSTFVEGCYRCDLSRDEVEAARREGQGGDGSPQLDLDAIERGHMMGDLDGGKHWVEMSAGQRSQLVALVRRLQQENEELRSGRDDWKKHTSDALYERDAARGRVEELTEALRAKETP